VRTHFPTVKGLWLPTSARSKKSLGVILTDGTRVHADAMSEGLLYWLAVAVLPHVDPTAILLIEEPRERFASVSNRRSDEGPARRPLIRKVILATHSPLVINELEPGEVTILTREPVTGNTRDSHGSHDALPATQADLDDQGVRGW
jgi:hypothetical protein